MSPDTPLRLSLDKETWEKLRSLKQQALKQQSLSSHPIDQEEARNTEDNESNSQQNLKKSWLEKRTEYRSIIEWLCKTFPAAFNYVKPLPLKLHITKDIYPHLPTDGSISKVKLRASIQYYTHATSYLKSLIKATHRVDLEGKEVESILDTHKQFTQDILAQRQEKRKLSKKPRKISNRRAALD